MANLHPKPRLTPEQVLQIYDARPARRKDNTFIPCAKFTRELAAQFDINERTVRDIWNRRTRREITRPAWTVEELMADLNDSAGAGAASSSSSPSYAAWSTTPAIPHPHAGAAAGAAAPSTPAPSTPAPSCSHPDIPHQRARAFSSPSSLIFSPHSGMTDQHLADAHSSSVPSFVASSTRPDLAHHHAAPSWSSAGPSFFVSTQLDIPHQPSASSSFLNTHAFPPPPPPPSPPRHHPHHHHDPVPPPSHPVPPSSVFAPPISTSPLPPSHFPDLSEPNPDTAQWQQLEHPLPEDEHDALALWGAGEDDIEFLEAGAGKSGGGDPFSRDWMRAMEQADDAPGGVGPERGVTFRS